MAALLQAVADLTEVIGIVQTLSQWTLIDLIS